MGHPSSLLALACVPLVASCYYYKPNSFAQGREPFPGKRVTLACLDVAVTLADDPLATQGPVVRYTFGNHCTHAATVDLGAVRVIGRAPDGSAQPLHAYDPKHELAPLPLDAWYDANEEIMYVADAGSLAPNVVCVDVGAAERVATPREHWVCLGAADEGEGPLGGAP